MKKLCSIFLTAILLLSSLPFAFAADEILGDWYAASLIMNGTETKMADFNTNIQYTFKDDGTVDISVSMMGGAPVITAANWKKNGSDYIMNTDAGDEITLKMEDGILKAYGVDGSISSFSRQSDGGKSYVPGEAKSDAAMADYNGEWKLAFVESAGSLLKAEFYGENPPFDLVAFTIADGKVTGSLGFDTLKKDFAVDGFVEEGAFRFSAADTFGNTKEIKLVLLQDSYIRFTVDTAGVAMSFYYQKVQ